MKPESCSGLYTICCQCQVAMSQHGSLVLLSLFFLALLTECKMSESPYYRRICCRNTEVLQEQLHAAQLRAEAAEKQVTQAEQLSLQLAELQSRQEVWDKVLQVA